MPLLRERFPKGRAFVTGAGSGLGRALCLELGALGFHVGVQDLREDSAGDTLREVVARGGRGRVFAFDVSDGEAFARAAEEYLREQGGLDLLFNNAGVATAGPILEVSREDWDWIIGANLRGPIEGCRAFVPGMRAAGSGHVVNVASLAGLVPSGSMGPYCVTKHGVVALSEVLRLELAGSGVSVSVVCPSFFQTNIAKNARSDAGYRAAAQWLMDKGWTSERVARAVLRGVERDRLYILPQVDARAFWALKRLSTRLFMWGAARLHAIVLHKAAKAGEAKSA